MNWIERWKWLKAYRTAIDRKEGTLSQRAEYAGRYNHLKFWWMKSILSVSNESE